MTTYDDREKNFEKKFAHDEEIAFKALARRNKMLGLWAAEKLGKQGDEAAQYAHDVVMADFEGSGEHDVVGKLLKDFTEADLPMTQKDILVEMERLTPIARQMVLEDRKQP